MSTRNGIILALLALCSCAPQPYKATNKVYRQQAKSLARGLQDQPIGLPVDSVQPTAWWAGTVNFNLRKPNFVIIHHTAQNSCEQTLKTFTMTRTQVSAHYVICRDGVVHHMLNDYLRAWHGGAAKWGNVTDINSTSIGIELDNNGTEPFAPMQVRSLLVLLDTLKHRYNIPAANFIGHGDIAPRRKVDPSVYFPWQQLAEKGFGLWFDTSAVSLPANFDTKMALRIVGYNVQDSTGAVEAFRRKFNPADSTKGAAMSEGEQKILYSLMKQSQ
ncbi:N-acetylmuramoyl-L-alanine amidase [Chitinophaga horti]|uniref:N-acetylmuramoyl-L-alanine amidase n=1 Tax=Chitinophaga horti TaxID=2920382 RepID=A0ABY6J759_9BACT|nr:N-acetylmuramoyl-L-alanine amidase [Chitinophaga horti]UYQ95320.1 N-acetylmuramoyl-L-alanine amidase [Chitinophaga horti]